MITLGNSYNDTEIVEAIYKSLKLPKYIKKNASVNLNSLLRTKEKKPLHSNYDKCTFIN